MPPKKVDVSRAIKMQYKGNTLQQIASAQNVSKQAIHQAIKPILERLACKDTVEYYRANQADIIDGLAAKTLSSVVDGDLEKASLQQKVVSFGILTDKSRLIQGLSTENISTRVARAVRDLADDDY